MSKGILDCQSISRHISFCILGATLFEEAFLNWSDATLYEELLLMVSKDASSWASYRIPPFWKREYWKYQYLCTQLKRLTLDIIQQCGKHCSISTKKDQSKCEEKDVVGEPARNTMFFRNILSDYSSLHGEKEAYSVSKEEPFGDILGVMFHGCLTITNLVCSILTRLVLHPELQKKVSFFHSISQSSTVSGIFASLTFCVVIFWLIQRCKHMIVLDLFTFLCLHVCIWFACMFAYGSIWVDSHAKPPINVLPCKLFPLKNYRFTDEHYMNINWSMPFFLLFFKLVGIMVVRRQGALMVFMDSCILVLSNSLWLICQS